MYYEEEIKEKSSMIKMISKIAQKKKSLLIAKEIEDDSVEKVHSCVSSRDNDQHNSVTIFYWYDFLTKRM